MAVTRGSGQLNAPPLDDIDLAKVGVAYDPTTDTLAVTLTGAPRPAISRYVDDNTLYRVDPTTDAVVAVEVERFLERLLTLRSTGDDVVT